MSSSLRKSGCVKDTVGSIRLSLNSDVGKDKIYVLVEGVDDCKIYPKFFNEKNVNVEDVYGKGKISEALEELNNITKQIIGICDADFNHLQNISPSFDNLFFTDCHDIEMTMLFVDGVLKDALTEYKLQDKAQEILQKALNEAKIIGYIRWFNEINSIKLYFKKLGLGEFLTLHSIDGNFKIDSYLQALNARSENKAKTVTIEDINDFGKDNYTEDFFNLCNGHDVTALMALMVGKKTSHENFLSVLRASFNVHYFQKTKLYKNIFWWQTYNGVSILK